MKRAIFAGAVIVLGAIGSIGDAGAQSKSLKEQIVGTWILNSLVLSDQNGVKSTPWGEPPLGAFMFDEGGHFAEIIANPDKDGSIDYFGTYSVNEMRKEIVLHVVGSGAKRFDGTDAKRIVVSISDDAMETHNPAPSQGSSAESLWKRAK
jgi:hypothetical protein